MWTIEGVQVAFEYPRLGVSKVIIPKVLKSTEMEVISPDLLEWCSIARKKYHSRELCLSISLLCGGVKDSADNTTVEMVAREGKYYLCFFDTLLVYCWLFASNRNM